MFEEYMNRYDEACAAVAALPPIGDLSLKENRDLMRTKEALQRECVVAWKTLASYVESWDGTPFSSSDSMRKTVFERYGRMLPPSRIKRNY